MPTARPIPRLTDLRSTPPEELELLWQTHFRSPRPATALRDYLIRALAYRFQEQRYGGLSAKLRRRLVADNPNHGTRSPRPVAATILKPGTRVLREWRGEMHEAVVLEKGFMYRGKTFKSLSVIAREITGTRWSGPSFFGLKSSATPIRTEANKLAMETAHGS